MWFFLVRVLKLDKEEKKAGACDVYKPLPMARGTNRDHLTYLGIRSPETSRDHGEIRDVYVTHPRNAMRQP